MIIKKIRKVVVGVLIGANVATILLMLVVGYAGRVSPISYPLLSNMSMLFPIFLIINFFFLVVWAFIKLRYVLLPLIGFAICYGPVRTYMPINFESNVPEDAIKVMSYNVWYFGRDAEFETSMKVPAYIAEENADIVCLQETDSRQAIQAGVAERLDGLYPHRDTIHSVGVGDVLALYSKYPIIKKERIGYGESRRSAVAYHLDLGTDTLIVLNAHFQVSGLSSEDRKLLKNIVEGEVKREDASAGSKQVFGKLAQAAKKRAPQAKALAKFIENHKGNSIVVCGDFNDTPLSYAHRQVAKGMKDCFVESGNGFGFSYNRGGMYVRIDNILCSEDITPYACKVDKKIDISDHYPIKCYIKIR